MSDLNSLTTVQTSIPVADSRGVQLTEILSSLSDPGTEARLAASATADRLRNPYLMSPDGAPTTAGMASAVVGFAMDLADSLPNDRIEHWLELARFAVQAEMFLSDDRYVFRAEAHEVLVDLDDYLDTDDERFEANEDSAERWANLADIATYHAFAEGSLGLPQAV